MNILYVAGLFRKKSCSASIRNVALVNGLASIGCKVTVVTVKFPSEVLDPFLVATLDSSVEVVEVDAGRLSKFIPQTTIQNDSGVRKVDSAKQFLRQLICFPGVDRPWIKNLDVKAFRNFDIVVSSSDTKTSHFVAEKIVSKISATWLQIWGDPWSSDVAVKNSFIKMRALFYEKRILSKSDYVSYVSFPTVLEMKKRFPNLAEKISFLPRSYLKEVHQTNVNCNDFLMAYTGVLVGRNINPILEAITQFNSCSEHKIHLHFYGKVTQAQSVAISDNMYCHYKGSVAIDDIYKVYANYNALLYIGNSSSTSQIPGKLYDYFGTQLPILALVEDLQGDVFDFIKSSGRCSIYMNNEQMIDLNSIVRQKTPLATLADYAPQTVARKLINIIGREI